MKKTLLSRFANLKTPGKLLGFIMIIAMSAAIISMSSCSKNDDDEPDSDISGTGGGSQSSYTLSQLKGHWVDQEAWKIQRLEISSVDKYSMPSSSIIGAISDVEGFYIDASNSRAYDLFIEATTTKYSNNDVAGNKVIASWIGSDGVSVYVMNISGSRNNAICRMIGNDTFSYNGTSYTIVSTSEMRTSRGKTYIKVTL